MTPLMPLKVSKRRASGPPRRFLWTVEEFHKLGDMGCFEGRRAMLIDGELIEEGAMNPPHRIALELTCEALRAVFTSGWRVCVQLPLIFSESTDPEPDIAIVAGSARGTTSHPTTAALVVEVSDTSLRYDTTEKMSLYAAGGIADYWVVDVTNRQLLVFRDPQADSFQSHGFTYATQLAFKETDSVSPLVATGSTIRVSDLLP